MFDLSKPDNQRKLEVVEQLARLAEEAALPLIHLALAFVLRHPGVTSAIIGPRTLDQLESQLGAAEVVLTEDVLNRIDGIVEPGRDVRAAESFAVPRPAFEDRDLRRRPADDATPSGSRRGH